MQSVQSLSLFLSLLKYKHKPTRESLAENCFREIFKNELRQDVFSYLSFSLWFIVFRLLFRFGCCCCCGCLFLFVRVDFSFYIFIVLWSTMFCNCVFGFLWFLLVLFIFLSSVSLSSTTICGKPIGLPSHVESNAASLRAYKFWERNTLRKTKRQNILQLPSSSRFILHLLLFL